MNIVSEIINSLKQKLANSEGSEQFDHAKAQVYEKHYATEWLDHNFERVYKEVSDKKKQKHIISDEFFRTQYQWNKFVNYIERKTCLEIGSGPAGALIRWYWAKKRIIIDPLASQYKRLSLKKFGKSLFTDDMILYSQKAETYLPYLRNTIDGVIVCRNVLDHCANPIKVIRNISQYAKRGCYLLLWTDIYHTKGHNEGHTNITKSKKEFENIIKKNNFEIHYTFRLGKRNTLNYGCVARKN